MSAAPIAGIRACVFDAYGTLFDFASAAAACPEFGEPAARAVFTGLWRTKQLEYAWLRSLQGKHADFWRVTGDALDYAMEACRLFDPSLRERLMRVYLTLSPFPDAVESVRRVRTHGMATAILSNGSPAMLSTAVEAAGMQDLFDAVLSVEEVGVYKPHPSVYQLAVDRLGVPANEIVFLSSNGWDAYAASAFGMRAVWCNRNAGTRERLPGAPEREIRSLDELPALLGIA